MKGCISCKFTNCFRFFYYNKQIIILHVCKTNLLLQCLYFLVNVFHNDKQLKIISKYGFWIFEHSSNESLIHIFYINIRFIVLAASYLLVKIQWPDECYNVRKLFIIDDITVKSSIIKMWHHHIEIIIFLFFFLFFKFFLLLTVFYMEIQGNQLLSLFNNLLWGRWLQIKYK